ncbi:alpha/beta hydrolase [Fibrella aquatilis]|uniref:Alpha/beta hydrolase n=1 Tax=Fibrella aquatilis TaxID=2817059 RepID=A0A939G7B6_9BACT|nr:alpha/beta hydrolase [Fibrella aquatilis]MBO0931710.1 alpha/beta hydrolase [Fibrella aquatilis]
MKQLYIFSGLGADERVFQHLDFSGFATTFVRWQLPIEAETIEQYAQRITRQLSAPKPILIGVSFGGIMAIEIAKLIDSEKVILISSAKTKQDLPIYYRLAGAMGLHNLLPATLLKQANFITNWLFGVSSPAHKRLLKQILQDTDPVFLKWAIDKIARWHNQVRIANVVHIHGTNDHILPFSSAHSSRAIAGGGHLMVLNKAEELGIVLHQELRT